MFTGKMREQQQNEIKLNDMSPVGIQLLLDYAYTSRLTLNKGRVNVLDNGISYNCGWWFSVLVISKATEVDIFTFFKKYIFIAYVMPCQGV